ncbi:MAG: prealbumin-like fold domain-containing protein, partial [Acidimicrobiia bacterium]
MSRYAPSVPRRTGRIAVLLGALLCLSSLAIAPSMAAVPTLATDKPDYHPEETVHITGTGYEPGATYDVPVMRPDGSMVRGDASGLPGWDHVTADGSGNLAYDYILDGIFGAYQVRVYPSPWSGDWAEAPLAAVTFTDAANLDQCANDIPGVTPPCAWQNGNINGNNSSYAEGDVVPFRLRVTDLDTSLTTHTIHLNYDFTQAGHKAYDFLATYNATEQVDICGPGGGGPPHPLCANLPAPDTAPFPSDPLVVDGLSVAGAEAAFEAGGASHTRLLTIWGGSIVSITPASGPVHSGDFEDGNSTADFLVTFTSDTDAVILAWGGHIASSAYWNVANGGAPDGAGQISGSPWHMRTQSLDGSGLSNEDRSIQPSALIPGSSITVVKNTVPDDGADFVFTPSAGVNAGLSFILDDDGPGGSPTPESRTFPVDAGTHTVMETEAFGFELDSITCVDPTGNSAGDADTFVATFDVALGENVTCTFHNISVTAPPPGRIIVEKQVVGPADGTEFPFVSDFDGDLSNGADFSLLAGQSFDSGPLVAGTFAVNETVPDGWSLVSATCSDGSPVDAIVLGEGEVVTCTFTDEALPPPPPPGGGYDTYDDDP